MSYALGGGGGGGHHHHHGGGRRGGWGRGGRTIVVGGGGWGPWWGGPAPYVEGPYLPTYVEVPLPNPCPYGYRAVGTMGPNRVCAALEAAAGVGELPALSNAGMTAGAIVGAVVAAAVIAGRTSSASDWTPVELTATGAALVLGGALVGGLVAGASP